MSFDSIPQVFGDELTSLMEEQEASELESNWGKDITPRLRARKKFHEHFADPSVNILDVAPLVEIDGASFMLQPSKADLVRAREVLRGSELYFTVYEPADVLVHLCIAFQQVIDNFHGDISTYAFLFASDCEYRPHAEIRRLAPRCYLVKFGRYLIVDTAFIAYSYYDVVSILRNTDSGNPLSGEPAFDDLIVSGSFFESYMNGIHGFQFPHILTALAEGEKYRIAARFSHLHGGYLKLHRLMLTFLVAHELAHVIHGDLGDPPLSGRIGNVFDRYIDLLVKEGGSVAKVAKYYRSRYLPVHVLELAADAFATRMTYNASVDVFGSNRLGWLASTLLLATIAWTDRAFFHLRNRRDPAMSVGLWGYNRKPFWVDVFLPISRHPWGKTRYGMIGWYVRMEGDEYVEHMATFTEQAYRPFADATPKAFMIMLYVNSRPGELISAFIDQGLWSKYLPVDPLDPNPKEARVTEPGDLFGLKHLMQVTPPPQKEDSMSDSLRSIAKGRRN